MKKLGKVINYKCGALRVYFDYDKDFPDDDRICTEVKELQVRSLNTKWHASNFFSLYNILIIKFVRV